jgi:hypothetical protein
VANRNGAVKELMMAIFTPEEMELAMAIKERWQGISFCAICGTQFEGKGVCEPCDEEHGVYTFKPWQFHKLEGGFCFNEGGNWFNITYRKKRNFYLAIGHARVGFFRISKNLRKTEVEQ